MCRSSTSCSILLLDRRIHHVDLVESPAGAEPSRTNGGTPLLQVDKRVADLLSRMTLEEKATMLSGSGWMESTPIERLGIPAIKMADGPMGVRSWAGSSAITNLRPNRR